MKKVHKDKIINIENTDLFDNRFLFDYLISDFEDKEVEVIHLSDLLEQRKNTEVLERVKQKPAMYSNVYSPSDELEIFTELFDNSIKNKKRIHVIGVTLDSEIKMLEGYYEKLGFLREDINCFSPNFNIPYITASVKIENLMWKGSDYKRMREKIFFNPPVRESGQVKAMFKGINRGVIAGIYISKFTPEVEEFLGDCVRGENILSMTLSKVLFYNLIDIGFCGTKKELIINY